MALNIFWRAWFRAKNRLNKISDSENIYYLLSLAGKIMLTFLFLSLWMQPSWFLLGGSIGFFSAAEYTKNAAHKYARIKGE